MVNRNEYQEYRKQKRPVCWDYLSDGDYVWKWSDGTFTLESSPASCGSGGDGSLHSDPKNPFA